MDEKESSIKEIDWTKPMPGVDYSGFTWLGLDRSMYPAPSNRVIFEGVDYGYAERPIIVFWDECKKFTEVDYQLFVGYLREIGKMPYTSEELDNIFTYHAPVGNQVERYQKIREAAKNLAQVIIDNTTPSPEQTLAVREVEMACMRANQCVALRG